MNKTQKTNKELERFMLGLETRLELQTQSLDYWKEAQRDCCDSESLQHIYEKHVKVAEEKLELIKLILVDAGRYSALADARESVLTKTRTQDGI